MNVGKLRRLPTCSLQPTADRLCRTPAEAAEARHSAVPEISRSRCTTRITINPKPYAAGAAVQAPASDLGLGIGMIGAVVRSGALHIAGSRSRALALPQSKSQLLALGESGCRRRRALSGLQQTTMCTLVQASS